MTICRYYLQGTCRFGDRCRFEHVSTYNERNYNEPQYYRQNDYGQNRYDYAHNHSSTQNQRYRYGSPLKLTYDDDDSGTFPRQQNYGRPHMSSNYQNSGNVYSQNRYQWLSEDYKRSHQKSNSEIYNTSTPKTVSFSFKVPDSEIKKSNYSYLVNEDDGIYTQIVKEDALAWEFGEQWPFTCYSPCPDKFGFPEFRDISPEELRYAAYKAKENNSYESYVNAVQNNLTLIKQEREKLKVTTPQLINKIRRIRNGEKLQSAFDNYISIPFLENERVTFEGMDDVDASTNFNTFSKAVEMSGLKPDQKTTSTPFSFKLPDENTTSVPFSFKLPAEKATSTTFSFKLPAESESKQTGSGAKDGDPAIYTPLSDLTEEEKEQFEASTFVLGKIPTRPPPQVLCS